VRAACAEARASGPVTGALDLVLRDCITCARRVRTTLDLGAVAPSVCRAAMDAVDARGGIAGKRVFVIGSGRTGSLAAELAVERGARSLSACNRSPERAAHLVSEFGARMVAYESRYDVISQSDTVVCATSSPHTVVSADFVELSRPVMFVDLASPRDVDPRLAESGLVTIVDLDSIGAMCRGDLAELSGLETRAGMIVDAAVAETASAVEARI
jgi:glutamyl-tRNA reductase